MALAVHHSEAFATSPQLTAGRSHLTFFLFEFFMQLWFSDHFTPDSVYRLPLLPGHSHSEQSIQHENPSCSSHKRLHHSLHKVNVSWYVCPRRHWVCLERLRSCTAGQHRQKEWLHKARESLYSGCSGLSTWDAVQVFQPDFASDKGTVKYQGAENGQCEVGKIGGHHPKAAQVKLRPQHAGEDAARHTGYTCQEGLSMGESPPAKMTTSTQKQKVTRCCYWWKIWLLWSY